MDKPKIKLGITLGDYNGIGPEVIIKTLADNRILNFCTPIIYGSGSLINKTRKLMHVENFSFQQIKQIAEHDSKRINVLNCWEEELELNLGKPSPESGRAALQSIQVASADLKAGLIDGIVTAPIDKDNIQSEDFKFPGHTEYFTSYFEAPE